MSNFYNNRKSTNSAVERIKKKPYHLLFVLFLLFLFLYVFGFFGERRNQNKEASGFTSTLNSTFQTEIFAYRANSDLKGYDISIITQFTVDRFDRIAMMADKWRAPISAAVYIKSYKDIEEVYKLVRNSYAVSEFVDLHFLFTNNTRYPVNNLRNLALRNSRTEWCLLLDVDFVSPLGMYDYLHSVINDNLDSEKRSYQKRHGPSTSTSTIEGEQIMTTITTNTIDELNKIEHRQQIVGQEIESKISFVIPSFSSSLSRFDFPDNKKDLIDLVNKNEIKEINSGVCPKCHGPTNYKRWYLAVEPYEVEYKWIYEPFLLYNKSQIDDYDERLKGYGFDKNSHTFGMAASGFDFIVLPDAWIIHMNHKSKPWEGADTFDEQMYDSLTIVCNSILPESKLKNGYDPNKKLFNEPLKDNDSCISNQHW